MKTTTIKSWLIPLILTLGLGVFFYPVQNKYSQSFKFVDEAEHMVMAWLLNKGYRLYSDFPNNHQPIPYFGSYIVEQVTSIDNVFMLLRRHRQAIFLWSVIWWFILLKRFGKKMLIPITIYESMKYLILGNEFLAEPIMVYPLAYLVAGVMTLHWQKKVSRLENWWVGFLTGFIQLTLLPMALTLVGLTSVRFILTRGKGLMFFGLGLLAIILAVFIIVNPVDYVREVINALTYSVSGLNPIKNPVDVVKIIGLPLLYLPYYKDLMGQVTIAMTSWWLISLGVLAWKRKKRELAVAIAVMICWLITNTRVNEANVYFYEGFHLIPWLLIGLTGGIVLLSQTVKYLNKHQRLLIYLLVILELGAIVTNRHLPVYAKIDPLTENYIQFTPMAQAAEKINILKREGDRLMVIPNESWLYFMTDLMPAPTNMFTYYDWQVEVPKNRYLFYKTLTETPPTFVVYYDDGSSYSPIMNEFLKYNYYQLMQYPNVYIHNKYVGRINK